MATNKTPIKIELTSDERATLEQVARSLSVPHRDVVRAKTILLLAKGTSVSAVAREVGRARRIVCKWADRFIRKRLRGLSDAPRSGRPPRFPPIVATHLVKLACELPDDAGRSLSTWTCAELARTLRTNGIVDTISPQSVERILSSYKLKPWRVHHWLSTKVPRDETFRAQVQALCDLYTRPLSAHERVLSVDEKTSLQPRTRTSPTRPARPGGIPVQLEHEYQRKGALNLLAAFDTRTGDVIGICRRRKRQLEFIELLEAIDRTTPSTTTLIYIVLDNVITHKGKLVRAWLAKHPRFQFHFTPNHCSWMNQVEQWFSILQRKRLRVPNFADLQDLERKILAFIDEWNEEAAPFNWTQKSFEKTLAKVDAALKAA